MPLEERILAGFFLCEHQPSAFLQSLKPLWNNNITMPVPAKLEIVNLSLQGSSKAETIFPYENELSDEIDFEKFSLSFLEQPRLFVRIRPGYKESVLQKLELNGIQYEAPLQDCIALPNSSKITDIIAINKEAVIQDYNSQRVGELLKLATGNLTQEICIWDCCAASGGKSILAYDINPSIELTVSDKRRSILENLSERFRIAGIKNYTSFVADLSSLHIVFSTLPGKDIKTGPEDKRYDLIVADVPCTGSGTWARTPEQLHYFDEKQLKKYSDLQRQIVDNVIGYLKPGGYLLYVTCSVFKKENEEAADYVTAQGLHLVKMQLLKGYEIQADTMFCALFTLPRMEVD